MKIQSLNGWWDYRVLGGRQKKIKVPFSSLAVGRFYCEKTFSLKYKSDKIFIKFDRITYQANVTLNGKFLGVLGPYAEYFFDVTDIVKKCDNRIVVEVFDLTPKFGPSEGWENYGGIIGDVNVLLGAILISTTLRLRQRLKIIIKMQTTHLKLRTVALSRGIMP